MSDLRDLYQELIVDHSKKPRNFHEIPSANRVADGYNPLCGDKIRLFLKVDDNDVIQDASFTGSGCAISTASASMMTGMLKGQTLEQARSLFDTFHYMVAGNDGQRGEPSLGMGKLAVFAGVNEFPTRVKCATLAWHTLKNAIEGRGEVVSTE